MTMTQHLNVPMPDELLAALDALAAEHKLNRSQFTRMIIGRAVEGPELYLPPALPNWQAEAWTSLLRGLFGDERLVLTNAVKPLLAEAVANLNERDAKVLRLRFGLNGPRHTLKEVGDVFGVKRSRVHQVEQVALTRMRGWCRGRGIWDLIGEQLLEEEA